MIIRREAYKRTLNNDGKEINKKARSCSCGKRDKRKKKKEMYKDGLEGINIIFYSFHLDEAKISLLCFCKVNSANLTCSLKLFTFFTKIVRNTQLFDKAHLLI